MLSSKLRQILRSWWPVNKPKEWLFPGDRVGTHITRAAVEDACQKAHRISRISKPITPHSLRHYPEFRTIQGNRLPSFIFKESG
jgi:integrase/recombinase XerD